MRDDEIEIAVIVEVALCQTAALMRLIEILARIRCNIHKSCLIPVLHQQWILEQRRVDGMTNHMTGGREQIQVPVQIEVGKDGPPPDKQSAGC